MGDICDRCGRPVILRGSRDDQHWEHAEAADMIFCQLVMRAPGEHVEAEDGDGV